jgi:hypothetical protein
MQLQYDDKDAMKIMFLQLEGIMILALAQSILSFATPDTSAPSCTVAPTK